MNTHRLKSCQPCHRVAIYCESLTLLLWQTHFFFENNSFFHCELKNFPHGTTLKIIITDHRFVNIHFFLRHKLDSKFNDCRNWRALLATTCKYHSSIPSSQTRKMRNTRGLPTMSFYSWSCYSSTFAKNVIYCATLSIYLPH